jgi:hypothetical protein
VGFFEFVFLDEDFTDDYLPDFFFVIFRFGYEFLSVVVDFGNFSHQSLIHLIDATFLLLDGFLDAGEEVAESFGVD